MVRPEAHRAEPGVALVNCADLLEGAIARAVVDKYHFVRVASHLPQGHLQPPGKLLERALLVVQWYDHADEGMSQISGTGGHRSMGQRGRFPRGIHHSPLLVSLLRTMPILLQNIRFLGYDHVKVEYN